MPVRLRFPKQRVPQLAATMLASLWAHETSSWPCFQVGKTSVHTHIWKLWNDFAGFAGSTLWFRLPQVSQHQYGTHNSPRRVNSKEKPAATAAAWICMRGLWFYLYEQWFSSFQELFLEVGVCKESLIWDAQVAFVAFRGYPFPCVWPSCCCFTVHVVTFCNFLLLLGKVLRHFDQEVLPQRCRLWFYFDKY